MLRRRLSCILLFVIISSLVLYTHIPTFNKIVIRKTSAPTKLMDGKNKGISSTVSFNNDSDNESLLTSQNLSQTTIARSSTPTRNRHLPSSIFNSSLESSIITTTPSAFTSISTTLGTHTSNLFPNLTVAKSTTPANTIHVNFSGTSALSTTTTTLTLSDNDTRVICHTFTGRLGNILFQYASVLGLSYSLNRTAIFRNSKYLDQILQNSTNHPARHQELNARCNGAPFILERSCCKFDPRLYDLNPKQDYWVIGYLQSYKYFDQYRYSTKAAVTFNEKTVKNASKIVSRLRQHYKNCQLIGVHARMGDFLSEKNKKLGYPVASPDYYNRSFTYFANKFPNCVFVVSSENIDWCKANMPGGFNVTYLDNSSAAVDMAILSSLDHIVTTFGSFSWWSGYLNSGITVYMKDFIKPNTFVGNQFFPNGTEYILPGWVPI